MKMTSGRIKVFSFLLGGALVGCAWIYTQNLLPVGEVDNTKIYKYQVNRYLSDRQSNTIKNIAEDKAFYTAMDNLGVCVSDDEVENAMLDVYKRYGGKDELKNIMIFNNGGIESMKNSVKMGLCQDKAIAKLSQDIYVSDEEFINYYVENMDAYSGEFEEVKEKVKSDLLYEKGGEKLGEYLDEIKATAKVVIY